VFRLWGERFYEKVDRSIQIKTNKIKNKLRIDHIQRRRAQPPLYGKNCWNYLRTIYLRSDPINKNASNQKDSKPSQKSIDMIMYN
jgi:hypothetical protein